jgi:hypothetical protein
MENRVNVVDMRTGETSRSNVGCEDGETPVRIECHKCGYAIWFGIRDGVPTEVVCGRTNAKGERCGGREVFIRTPRLN